MKSLERCIGIVGAAGVVLTGCVTGPGSPDSPGYSGDGDEASPETDLYRWSVTDVDTGEVVAEGCPYKTDDGDLPRVSGVPGQRLLFERWGEHLTAKVPPDVDSEFWCAGTDSRIRREVLSVDFDPSCWQARVTNAERSAGRAIWWDADATERPSNFPDDLPDFVPGEDRLRIWLEVEQAGDVTLESSGSCDTDSFFGVVTIRCSSDLHCVERFLCLDGECGSPSCSPDAPCPDAAECLNGICRREETL